MNFSIEWEKQYQAGDHMSVWPWSDLISYVHRFASPKQGFDNVLELGCGAGANIPFFQSLEVNYSAIDGSRTVINLLKKRFPEIASNIVQGDFTKDLPFDQIFDLVVDRSSLISSNTLAIQDGLKLAASKMRTGGRFIGVDWFSTKHEGFTLGKAVDDHTRDQFPEASDLYNIGTIHFCSEDHLSEILERAQLKLLHLEHKTNDIVVPDGDGKRGWWNFVAEKQ